MDDWRSNKRFMLLVAGGVALVGAVGGFLLAPYVHDRAPTVPDRFLNAGEAALLFVLVIGRFGIASNELSLGCSAPPCHLEL